MRFWLGTHNPGWLATAGVPLFVSRVRLQRMRRLPRASAPWAMDSGGFTALDGAGGWDVEPDEYVELVQRFAEEIGMLEWAAPMDWMCEPRVIASTGLSVREHQERTVASFLELRGRGPFIPVLQGWAGDDYHECVALYTSAGVDLAAEPLVGLGTVCRRQATPEIARVVHELWRDYQLPLHGFGVKKRGLARCAHMLASADSMAWSSWGRNAWFHEQRRLCDGSHRGGCANCAEWALRWRAGVVDGMGLFAGCGEDA